MKCNNCKKEIDNDSKFCEFCGAKIERNIKVVKVKLKEVLFNKNSIHFWVFLLSTILLVVLFSSFTQQANLSLEDILYLQSSSHF